MFGPQWTHARVIILPLVMLFCTPVAWALEKPVSKPAEKPGAPTADMKDLADDGNRFALDLYAQLQSGEGNLFFSPSSISLALAMTNAGAAGTTREEMARTLHFQLPPARLDAAMQALLTLWKKSDRKQGYRLRVANRLWGQKSYEFLPAFLDTTRTRYGAELAELDFSQATEASRQTINRWVADQTEKKIVDLIPSGALTQDSKLVLTNAVYFKGDWSNPFDKQGTSKEDFTLASGRKVKTPLMHQQDEFGYAAVDGLQVLALPYGDASLSMVVLLPEQADGLANLQTQLSYDNLQPWLKKLHTREVLVYLPKFKMTASCELSETLSEMGMPSAFDASTADFSGMTGGKDLCISSVIHKAFVDVNEEGTEAAAATGVVMAPTAMPVQDPIPEFRADHPFIFLIQDNRTGTILFLGRLVDPTK